MLPFELKKDKDNLFYLNDSEDLGYLLPFYNNKSLFYEIVGNKDFIVKCSNNNLSKKSQSMYKDMLMKLLVKQELFHEIDFPIGYYQENNKLNGLIIPYYNSFSLKEISESHDINEITKYYYHDDDSIHNLFILYLDILNLLEHLFSEKIYYTDVHPGNFVFSDNEVKLIDFEIPYIHFNKWERDSLRMIINNYVSLVYLMSKKFGFEKCILSNEGNFSETKLLLKTLENRVRKEYK